MEFNNVMSLLDKICKISFIINNSFTEILELMKLLQHLI